jgi:purine-binding chemotaxis protein CheW
MNRLRPTGQGIVTITVAGQRHAVALHLARDVVAVATLTPVPNGPRLLLGLFQHRGRIVPLYDLAGLLGMPGGHRADGLALVCHRGGQCVAFAVDEVEDASPHNTNDLACLDVISLLDTPHAKAA